tara:strand:+ start:166 stop:390 length:225 start_codon:yes stop_codon:yes gene_type:complete
MISLFYLEHIMIYLEPRAIFDAAIVQADPVVYDFDMLVDVLMRAYELNFIDAVEWYSKNIDPLKEHAGLQITGE